MRFLPLLLFALPFVEIAGFVVVGSHIGVLWTLALVAAAGMLGAVLLRVQGFGAMTRARAELAAGGDPSRELADAAMILVAGVLLLIPGFVTDIAGLLLFLPPVRHLAWRFFSRRIVVSTAGFGNFGQGFGRAGFGGGGVRAARPRQHDRPRRRRIQPRQQRRRGTPRGFALETAAQADRRRLTGRCRAYGLRATRSVAAANLVLPTPPW